MFKEHLNKENRGVTVEVERMGLSLSIKPLTFEELEECQAMGKVQGAKYALYLACEELRNEGKELFENKELFSPLDIANAFAYSDLLKLYRIILGISQGGKSKLKVNIPENHNFSELDNFNEVPEIFNDDFLSTDDFDEPSSFSLDYEDKATHQNNGIQSFSTFTLEKSPYDSATESFYNDFTTHLVKMLHLAQQNM